MRTKVLLCAAALAAGVASSVAQSNVYSLNVVGYVNVVLPPSQFTLVTTPLKPSNSSITNLFAPSTMADGCYIQMWDPALNDFSATSPHFYGGSDNVWDIEVNLDPGQGYFFYNAGPTAITNTFVGEVIQGSFTNAQVLANSTFSMLGSSAPLGGGFTNAIDGIVPADGDYVQVWNSTLNDWDANSPHFFGGSDNIWDPVDLSIPVGSGFMYYRSGDSQTWIRNFSVK